MNVKDEDPPKNLVRSLSRKVTGSIKRLFGSGDNLDEEDSSLLEKDEEEENVDLGPLWLPPVDSFSVDDDSDIKIIQTPGGLNNMDTRKTVPVEEGVISEAYSEGNTENEIALESIFQDEKEEDDNEENRSLSPTNVFEPTNIEPTLEQDTDEFTMRTLCIESVPPELEEDELIDLKRNDEPKKFRVMKLKDEKPPKNLVRTLSNKVKGSIKNIFSSRDNLNEEDLSDDERTADVENVILGPLSLAPIEYTEMDSKDKVSLVYHFEDDDNAREAKQIEENVITEEHDEGDTETEVQLDSIFCDDEQPDENQDSAFSPQFHELDKNESEPTTEQETTELSTRTVHRLVIPERIADDDDLSDLKTGDEPIEYTVMNVKDEDPPKNLVRSLSRKVTGSIKRLFGSGDNLDEEDSSLLEKDEEEENVDLGPLWLPPVDSFSVDDDSDIKIIQTPGGLNNMDTRKTVPVEEGVISEAYSEGNTENEIALESIFQDEKEEDDNEENRSLSPTNVFEPTNIEPTLEQDTDEFTMRTLCIESVPPELEEDELIDLKRNDEPKKFTIMKLKDEKPPKNLVRTLSNKVKGSIKNIFSSRDNLNEEDLSDDERTADVESVNLGPLSLAPIEYTEMDSKDKVSLVYHFEDDDNAREAKQIEENFITEEHDEGDTETEVQLDSIFCDDEQRDENQDSAFSPQFHELDKSESERTTEQETTDLSTRTVHRLVIPERIADDDDLSDLKTGDEPIEYTVMNVKDEDPPKNLVRSLSRKVTGSIKRLFGSRDNLDEEDSSLLENDEEEENFDLGPLWLPPVDSFSVDDDSDIKIIQTPGGLNIMDTRETVPVEEGVISEAYSEGNTENEIALESIFQDEKEEDDNEENRFLSPTDVLEPTNIEPTLEQDTDEFTMRTLCIESVPPELEEDELIDLKRNDEPKKFTIMKLKDEKPPKNLVRTLSNKVKGSIKNIFSSRDNLNEEDLSDDERTADVESVNLGPLSLAPIEYTEMDSKDKVSLVYHFEDDDNAREAKPIEENVITEEHDEGDTETEVQLDSIFCDDEQPDENQDSAFSPQFPELDKSECEPTTEQETTELSTRTVHRLVIPERIADDDDLSDLKTGDEPIEYTVMNVKDEDPPKNLVRSLSRKVTGSIKRLFGSRDNLDEEDSSLLENDEEEENVDLGPLWLPPVDFFSADDDSDIKIIQTPEGLNNMDPRKSLPVEEGVISEAYSEGNTENEIALESIFQDEKEEDDNEENRSLSPTDVLEPTNIKPRLEQDTDDFSMRTLCIESVPPELEEDELIDLKRNDEPKKFTIMKLKDEKPPKNLVRTLSNKVKGSIKNIFSSRDNLNEEDLSDDERTTDVESVNLGPLSLAPIEYTEMDSKDKVSLVYHVGDDENAKEAKPIEENVITEEHDEGDTETEVQLHSIFCDDEQPDENQDSAFSPQFHKLDKSENEPTTEQETTELSTRTVHRQVIPENVENDDDLSDLKTGGEPIEYTVMVVKDEDPPKNLVRSLSRKFKGTIKRILNNSSNEVDVDSVNELEEYHISFGPIFPEPVDSVMDDNVADVTLMRRYQVENNVGENVPVEEDDVVHYCIVEHREDDFPTNLILVEKEDEDSLSFKNKDSNNQDMTVEEDITAHESDDDDPLDNLAIEKYLAAHKRDEDMTVEEYLAAHEQDAGMLIEDMTVEEYLATHEQDAGMLIEDMTVEEYLAAHERDAGVLLEDMTVEEYLAAHEQDAGMLIEDMTVEEYLAAHERDAGVLLEDMTVEEYLAAHEQDAGMLIEDMTVEEYLAAHEQDAGMLIEDMTVEEYLATHERDAGVLLEDMTVEEYLAAHEQDAGMLIEDMTVEEYLAAHEQDAGMLLEDMTVEEYLAAHERDAGVLLEDMTVEEYLAAHEQDAGILIEDMTVEEYLAAHERDAGVLLENMTVEVLFSAPEVNSIAEYSSVSVFYIGKPVFLHEGLLSSTLYEGIPSEDSKYFKNVSVRYFDFGQSSFKSIHEDQSMEDMKYEQMKSNDMQYDDVPANGMKTMMYFEVSVLYCCHDKSKNGMASSSLKPDRVEDVTLKRSNIYPEDRSVKQHYSFDKQRQVGSLKIPDIFKTPSNNTPKGERERIRPKMSNRSLIEDPFIKPRDEKKKMTTLDVELASELDVKDVGRSTAIESLEIKQPTQAMLLNNKPERSQRKIRGNKLERKHKDKSRAFAVTGHKIDQDGSTFAITGSLRRNRARMTSSESELSDMFTSDDNDNNNDDRLSSSGCSTFVITGSPMVDRSRIRSFNQATSGCSDSTASDDQPIIEECDTMTSGDESVFAITGRISQSGLYSTDDDESTSKNKLATFV
eukprot:gene8031-8890_t